MNFGSQLTAITLPRLLLLRLLLLHAALSAHRSSGLPSCLSHIEALSVPSAFANSALRQRLRTARRVPDMSVGCLLYLLLFSSSTWILFSNFSNCFALAGSVRLQWHTSLQNSLLVPIHFLPEDVCLSIKDGECYSDRLK